MHRWWTIADIAERLHRSRKWVSRALLAGRFGPPGGIPERERAFFWFRDGTSRGRGAEVRIGDRGLEYYLSGTVTPPAIEPKPLGIPARSIGELRRNVSATYG